MNLSLKTDAVSELSEKITAFLKVEEKKDIISFAQTEVDLSGDISAPKSRVDFSQAPFLLEPLQAATIEKGKRKTVCFAAPEQMGKSLLLNLALIFACRYSRLQGLILYPSLELATETARTKFVPLFKNIEKFKEDLNLPFAIKSDRIKLSNSVLYWQGAGTPAVSRSCQLVAGDEISVWESPPGIDNVLELQKRTRSYAECLQLFVSTPKIKTDSFWRVWQEGSQAVFTLRCQGCKKWTLPTSDIFNLQFETKFNDKSEKYEVIKGSERLICPDCQYEHTEAEKEKLIQQGKYIHTFPERKEEKPSFRLGVLASMLPVHSWGNIASAQLAAGRSSSLAEQMSFENSLKGIPYTARKLNIESDMKLKEHFYKKIEEEIKEVFVTADTQDSFSVVGVFARSVSDNLYLLEIVRPRFLYLDEEERKVIDSENRQQGKPPEVTLWDIFQKEYLGKKPVSLLIDMRGHRTSEVREFAKKAKNILCYAGTSLKFEKWKISKNDFKIFLVDARKFQAELIFNLYFSSNKKNNFIFLPANISKKDTEEITAVQPDKTKRNGHEYQNWEAESGAVHDLFDVLKMALSQKEINDKIFKKKKP